MRTGTILALAFAALGSVLPALAGDGVQPVPLTRDDVKQALENSKQAEPRLPLPPLTEAEQARAAEAAEARAEAAIRQGDTAEAELIRRRGPAVANNGRMRSFYLSDYGTNGAAGFNREPDPKMTLDPQFRVMMFWIVSRGNNCTYCLGHQESGLGSRGVPEDIIANLDGDWSEFDDAQRAAFAFTTKVSFEPHEITDADVDAMRSHYTDEQILEILLAVGGFNAMNRWTGPLRITQEERHVFLKPTSEKNALLLSRVAPLAAGTSGKGFAPPVARRRPPLEGQAEVQAALAEARERQPRIQLADASTTAGLLDGTSGAEPPQWMRLLAVFPKAGPARIAQHLATQEGGTLDARSKAIIAYVAARHDRAWYALGHAIERLRGLGYTDEQIAALDDPKSLPEPADRAVAEFARKITVDPALADDADFAELRRLFDDKKVAEIVYQITEAAFFDRLTEAAGLPLEADVAAR